MRRRVVDANQERQFLIGMITSKPFLATVAPAFSLDLIEEDHFRTVASWCLDFYKTYRDAPGKSIESIYYGWVESQQSSSQTEAIHDFLESLSGEYDTLGDVNVPHLVDGFGKFILSKRLARLNDILEYNLQRGDSEIALQAITEFRSVDAGVSKGTNPLNDPKVWKEAFADPLVPLITFPGDAGRFLSRAFTRDALIAIQGPEKRGKTFWCLELVIRALRNRRKVALFEVGDLSQSQILMRLGGRLCGSPLRKEDCGDIHVPERIRREKDPAEEEEIPIELDVVTKRCPRPVSERACQRARKKFIRACGIPRRKTYLKFSVHPNSSINVRGIESILERWEQEENFVPDVIIIDYADILAPEDRGKEVRHQINETWKALRRLSQERHCLVVAPTQASAESYETKTQTMKHFSESKTKLAHVTGMLGLNQTEGEKDMGVMRLNWIVLREAEFSHRQCLWVGQCLKLGRAFCCATL